MSAEMKGKLETYEGGSVLPPGVHDALIRANNPEPEAQGGDDFDPEWFLCQTAVTLVGKFYYKEELKVGDGPYGKYCSFSLRTKKLKNGTPRTCFFYVKVWGNDLIALLERLPNETFIKVTGDLETWRNSTYIRARTIMPLLNLDQHVEELKQKEMAARMDNDSESMEEIRIAREAIGDIARRARGIVDSADGEGYAEQVREERSHPAAPEVYRAEEHRRNESPARQEETAPVRHREEAPPASARTAPQSEPKTTAEGDEKIMSAKEDLSYILDVLESMQDFDTEDDLVEKEKGEDTTDIDALLSRYAKKKTDAEDEEDEEDDYEEEDDEIDDDEKDDLRVSVVDADRGKVERVEERRLSDFRREERERLEEEERKERTAAARLRELETGAFKSPKKVSSDLPDDEELAALRRERARIERERLRAEEEAEMRRLERERSAREAELDRRERSSRPPEPSREREEDRPRRRSAFSRGRR